MISKYSSTDKRIGASQDPISLSAAKLRIEHVVFHDPVYTVFDAGKYLFFETHDLVLLP